MNLHQKPDWIGTPRTYEYDEDGQHYTMISIDFTLANEDARYKLVITSNDKEATYELKQFLTKAGSQKPFLSGTSYIWKNETVPLIDAILADSYVQAVLHQ
ncbi:DUF3910 family protein [Bacillus sp. 165]|uniref:DUF3910 family protein n=1 Tax=Bacillus sp. 165 TaxID=1529117 RepID=UPI001ADB528D|nr:DUF3910 family protein [Bacillus sp. 165]MBO9129978.1 DUF3910 family protein [Bacillus sp. 165]